MQALGMGPGAFTSLVVVVVIVLTVAYPVLRAVLALRRFHDAVDRADVPAMERAARVLDANLKPVQRAFLRIAMLEAQERWTEARVALLALDPAQLDDQQRVTRDNDIAWCLVHEGQAEAALPLASSAVLRVAPRSRANCLGTLGAALQRCGRPSEALETLQKAIALGGRARNLAIRNFYVGECQVALQRHHEAHEAFAAAVRLAPDSHFGRRAQARLQSLSHPPYR